MRLVQAFGRGLNQLRGVEINAEERERRLAAQFCMEIWQRAARMLRHCLPDDASFGKEAFQPPLVGCLVSTRLSCLTAEAGWVGCSL